MSGKLQRLEAMRGFAACYVFAGHFVLERLLTKGGPLGLPFRFGQEAVMVFFLISGFVISYAQMQGRESGFIPYIARRARRIYPIYLLALLVSVVTVEGFFAGQYQPSWGQVLGNLFMFQDFVDGKPGVWVAPLGGNLALWSLSYEWWFYVMFFPLWRYVPRQRQLDAVALIAATGLLSYHWFPNQISLFLAYFLIWWSGVELAKAYVGNGATESPEGSSGGEVTLWGQRRLLLYLVVACGLTALPVVEARAAGHALSFGLHPVLEFRHFTAALLLVIIGISWRNRGWLGFNRVFGGFTTLAPISYALYVFHFPLAISATYLAALPGYLALVCYVAITLVVAYIAEVPLQNAINRRLRIPRG